MKLPALRKPMKASTKSAFGRALTRFKARQEDKRKEALAADAPFVKFYTCAQTDEPFFVKWQRNPYEPLLFVRACFRIEAALPDYIWEQYLDRPLQDAVLPASVFSFFGMECPWCDAWQGFVTCKCGEDLCGYGHTAQNGVHRYYHDKCGNSFRLKKNGATMRGHLVPPMGHPPDTVIDVNALLRTLRQTAKPRSIRWIR